MSVDAVERAIDIDAPVEVVWQTISDPARISQWFADLVEVDVVAGASGTLTFRAGGDDPLHVGITVVAVEAPHRLAYRWVHPPGSEATERNSTLVTFTLHPDGEARTRLRVVERGIAGLDLDDGAKRRFADEHGHGWQVQGDRLAALLATA